MSKSIWTISATLAIALSTSATARDGVANGAVGARMDAMEIIAQNLKTVGGMAQGQVTFDADKAQVAIDAIAKQAANVPALFKAEEKDPKSKASDAIWTSWDDFAAKAGTLQTAAEGADASSVAGLGQALGGIGGSCRSCHMSYRIK